MKKKHIIYIGATILLLFIIVVLGKKTRLNDTLNNQKSTTTTTTNSTSSGQTKGKDNVNIEWTNTSITNNKKLSIYKISKYISNLNIDYIAEKFGFGNATKSKESEVNVQIWKKTNETLIINLNSNTLTYYKNHSVAQNSFTQQKSEDIVNKAKEYVDTVLDSKITKNLIPFSLSFYQQKNIYTVLSTREKANIYRASFTQTIDELQSVTVSETGGTITVYLDNDLNVYQIQINNIFSTPQIDRQITTTAIDELIKNSNQEIIRVSTNSDLGTNFEIASKETIDLKQHKIDIGYLIYPKIAIPSYIIQGDIKTDKGVVTEVYALPMTPIPEL